MKKSALALLLVVAGCSTAECPEAATLLAVRPVYVGDAPIPTELIAMTSDGEPDVDADCVEGESLTGTSSQDALEIGLLFWAPGANRSAPDQADGFLDVSCSGECFDRSLATHDCELPAASETCIESYELTCEPRVGAGVELAPVWARGTLTVELELESWERTGLVDPEATWMGTMIVRADHCTVDFGHATFD
jgi:hypothetical protein